MRISSLLNEDGILLKSKPKSKEEVINTLVECHFRLGNLNDKDSFRKAVLEREASTSTGIGGGMAIPHAMTEAVKRPAITAMTVEDGVDFKSLDGKPVNLIFMIAMPNDGKQHMNLLSHLATLMMDKSLFPSLTAVETPAEFIDFIDKLEDKLFPDESSEKSEPIEENKGYKILAVTACPMGISHTYMAAEALEKTAKEMHYSIKVETNGSAGAANVLTDEEIEKAEVIIIAADKNVDMERFNGKRVFITSVTDGLRKPKETIKAALSNKELYKYKGDTSGSEYISKPSIPMHETIAHKCYKHLMSGVSYMLPFAIGGGILHALSYFLDMIMLGNSALDFGVFGTGTQVSAFLNTLGEYAFQCMIPIFSGYIAMSIADRPGLVVGFVGGAIAANGKSGFLGALVAGFAAGLIIQLLKKIFDKLPKGLDGLKPVLLYPLLGVLLIGALMTFIIEPPVGALNIAINTGLAHMNGVSSVLLGALVAGMMAVDMGGPLNKAAYVFGTASIAAGNYNIMAAVMIGGMVPPIAIALGTLFFKNKFTAEERKAGPTNFIMGLSFITEGAIPFAAADPLRVIPACVVGSAIAGAMSMAFNCTLMAPHGGIFVFLVMGNAIWYLLSLIVGSAVSCLLLGLLKKKIV